MNNEDKLRYIELKLYEIKKGIENKDKEIEKLHSIIKEAREYIQDRYDGEALTHTFDKDNVKELLEILDTVEWINNEDNSTSK